MEIATIGFTHSSAEHFFGRLKDAGVERVLDIRLNNSSQLAGFAKSGDLAYFLRVIVGADYAHDLRLAPTPELLDFARKQRGDRKEFEERFLALMQERDVPNLLDRAAFTVRTALLCSEPDAVQCHRRFVADLLTLHWGAIVTHL